MMTKVFAIWDSKAQMYQAPFFMPAVGAAVRAFGDAVCDGQTTFAKHPSDYILYQIAELDDTTGEFRNMVPPLHLGVGADFVTKMPKAADVVREMVDRPLATVSELNGGDK